MVPGTGVPALPSWLSSLVLFPLLHPELHFSPLMFALGGPNSQCSALEKVTWSSECNHFFSFSVNYVPPLLFFMSFTFFVLCCETVYTEIYQRSKLFDFLMLFVNVDQSKNIIPPTTTGSGRSWQAYFVISQKKNHVKCFFFVNTKPHQIKIIFSLS